MKNKASKSPLPEPIELAKLAAILRRDPDSKPASALKVAMEFYLEAVILCRECAAMNFEDLITKFGSEPRWIKLCAAPAEDENQAIWKDTLELDPAKDTDAVRKFLAKCGLDLKTPGAVLNNIRKAWDARPQSWLRVGPRKSADALIAQCKTVSDGRTIHNIPRSLLEFTADYANERRKKIDRTSWHSRNKRNRTSKKLGKKNFAESPVEGVG
jgi:hypothetical protein